MYETDIAIAQYCEAHYGKSYFGVENFSVQCVNHAKAYLKGRPMKKALDIGCAVGRATFELAKVFESVTGLDYSDRFIRIALEMQEKGVIHYELPEEGGIVSCHESKLSTLGLDHVTDRVEFFQADATNIKPLFSGYDFILAANLIDRLYDPAKFLNIIHQRLNPEGLLMLTSPYTWMEEFTQREKWVGGFIKDGKPYTTIEGLQDLLRPHFRMIGEPRDIEFVIRETRRKFQHTLAQATVWERLPL